MSAPSLPHATQRRCVCSSTSKSHTMSFTSASPCPCVRRCVCCVLGSRYGEGSWLASQGRRDTLEPGMVAARHFNNVQIDGDYVVKTAPHSVLRVRSSGMSTCQKISPTSSRRSSQALPMERHGLHLRRRTVLFPEANGDAADAVDGGGSCRCSSAMQTQPNGMHGANSKKQNGATSNAERLFGTSSSLSHPSVKSGTVSTPSTKAEEVDGAKTNGITNGSNGVGNLKLTDGHVNVPAGSDGASHHTSPLPEGVSSLTLQRVRGVTFSHLITNRCLTPGRLEIFLRALRQIHSSAGDPSSLRSLDEVNVCLNYLPKLKKRYAANRDFYQSLSADSDFMFEWLEKELAEYENEARWQHSNAIHGDPVFSNVLLTNGGRVYLLDMRGEIGSTLTLQGDLTYDLSKVYQSLLGYDYIILGQALHEKDAEILEDLPPSARLCASTSDGEAL